MAKKYRVCFYRAEYDAEETADGIVGGDECDVV